MTLSTGRSLAAAVVEVLLLQKRDFDNVLKASIMKTWEEVREAMASFPYFQHWDEVAMRETCIMAKILRFQKDETILGEWLPLPATAGLPDRTLAVAALPQQSQG